MADPNRWAASVTRYAPTFVNERGFRTLMLSAQGRDTFATAEEAQARLDAIISGPNSKDTLASIWGDEPQFEVRAVECWPVHFDPKGVYFDP